MEKKIIFETNDKVYRILEIEDWHYDMKDLKSDCFNIAVNSDINPQELSRQEKEFENKVLTQGVYGYVLEKWNSAPSKGYEQIDGCWGFVGPNETENHYII